MKTIKSIGKLATFKKIAVVTYLASVLAACGGSGDSNKPTPTPNPTPTPTPNQAPVADAGENFSVNESAMGTLNGTGTDSDGTITTYLWTQTSGPSLTLSATDISSPTFSVPSVDADTSASFDFTVTDNGGLTATDSITLTIINVAQGNMPPSADAGSDLQGVIGETVQLDASNSSDSDGTINSYSWAQIDNGSPVISITAPQTMTASIVIPALSANTEFEFELTVTDDDGATAVDTVIVLGRPSPGINVGSVIGNTATVNSLAQFPVSLSSEPTADVSINILSSDDLEGIPEQSNLTFTPANWSIPQFVNVYGQNPNVLNGEQNYFIELFEATSSDTLYNGINAEDVVLKGIELAITAPANALAVMPSVPFVYQVAPIYTGSNPLTYSLSNAPAGMTIDFNDGVINWQPASTIAGGEVSAEVTVNDGGRFSNITLNLTVPQTADLATDYDTANAQLTITEADSNLKGVRLTQIEAGNALAALTLSKVAKADIPDLPTGLVALTDGLIANAVIDTDIAIHFSLSDLPSGVEIDDVRYYTFGEVSGTLLPVWSKGGFNRQFSGTEESPFVSFQFSQLPALGFFGYKDKAVASPTSATNSSKAFITSLFAEAAGTTDVTCVQKTFFSFDLDEFDCTSTLDTAVTITVEDWGSNTLRWGSVSKEQMVSWLVDARAEFTRQKLSFEDEFTVRIEAMNYLGFVNSAESRNILHITDNNSVAASSIQGTSVHEYYHHAQGHRDSELPNKSLVINNHGVTAWLYEGTARWVEDVIFDDINTYQAKELSGQRILEVGLKTGLGNARNRPYQRFAFFKLLDEKCPSMKESMQDIFNHTAASDPAGLKNLNALLSTMGCDFGDHFDISNNATLASALGFYNLATQFKNSITSLDSNETSAFPFDKPTYRFSPSIDASVVNVIAQPAGTKYVLQNVSQVKSAGAISFEVPALVGAMPEGKVAEILVQSTSQVYVSIASNDADFVSTNTIDGVPHTWFNTSEQSSFIYAEEANSVPKLFVTLVNADEDVDATVNVTFRIRDQLDVDTIISSHESGDDVDDRVVSISGSIPEEGRDFTNDVHITANGITTIVPMNSNGSFDGSVVMSLGVNNVNAQGFNGNAPTTREEIITLNGVAAGSTRTNALIASRVVFVLRWDTATDIDIYSKDPLNETIWFSDRTATLGNLDRDDTSGFGPEVISYRAESSSSYSNGQFDIDVHYYSGSGDTNYTVDVILNETEGANRRNYQFNSTTPLADSSSSEAGVDDIGTSRFNDILFITCNAASVCGLHDYDNDKLSLNSGLGTNNSPTTVTEKIMKNSILEQAIKTPVLGNTCEDMKTLIAEKYGFTPQSCDDEILK
ncbi:hypothetical protein EKO29_19165 [Colwellia sp. Arc7-635]|uniref:PKD domain-containing protein n=1 Tax=Colwellia sp. Arc7-635 TaxID=2497879 RepID=UPI000F854A07|nr:PKD domain-containing protein [Colwellia sp. Arc7-635]AZQ85928.1 hypothetical protein EKO29_19165 [Colwellia sp. Arc7-635]